MITAFPIQDANSALTAKFLKQPELDFSDYNVTLL